MEVIQWSSNGQPHCQGPLGMPAVFGENEKRGEQA
jgi:hypothetical protein